MENICFNWQTRQANLSSGQLWCYLELCWNCLQLMEKEWSHLSDDHWTCPCPFPSPVVIFAFETTGCKISQPEPSQGNKTKPEQQNKSLKQANKKKWVWTESILWLGLPNLEKCSRRCRGRGSREQCCLMQISTTSFIFLNHCMKRKNCLINK